MIKQHLRLKYFARMVYQQIITPKLNLVVSGLEYHFTKLLHLQDTLEELYWQFGRQVLEQTLMFLKHH